MPWHVVGCFFCGCPRGPKTSRHVFVFDCWRRPLVIKHGTIWVIINLYFIQLPMLQKTCVCIYICIYPRCSMYGIFTYIYPKNCPNAGDSIHGASGIYTYIYIHIIDTQVQFGDIPETPLCLMTPVVKIGMIFESFSTVSLPGVSCKFSLKPKSQWYPMDNTICHIYI